MTSIEERVRAAAQATASRVQRVRPLELPATAAAPASARRRLPPRPATWRGSLIPLTAAAAIVAVAALLVVVHQGQNDSGHPSPTTSLSPASPQQQPSAKVAPACGGPAVAAAPAATVPSDVPQYFAELCGFGRASRIVVADTRTGAVLGSVPASSGNYEFTGVYGAADDQTFLVSATEGTPKGAQTGWWMLRLAPGTAHPVQYTKLPWTLAGRPLSIALSPDGTQIAVSGAQIRVYSLATGAVLHTWTISGTVDEVTWTGDGQGLVYMHNGSTIWVHNIATPGSDLSAGSTPLISLADPGTSSSATCDSVNGWAVSSDGTTFICTAATPTATGSLPSPASSGGCASNNPIHMAFQRFAAGAHLPGSVPVGTDYSATDPCGANSDKVSLWWASADGTEVIGQVSYPGHNEIGVFYDGTYVPLPALSSETSPQFEIFRDGTLVPAPPVSGPYSPLVIAF
jgi:hypothetical protein